MVLTGSFVVAFVILFFQRAAAEEFCYSSLVNNISCSRDEHIYVESAIIGRLNNSKCYNRTNDEQECKRNIRNQIQLQFLRKNIISISTIDANFIKLQPTCLGGLPSSFSITHQCRRGYWNDSLEFCVDDTVTLVCLKEESLVIESAFLGRYYISRCHVRNENEASCKVDIKMALKDHFGDNKSISISMADPFIRGLTSNCPISLSYSMKVSYRCSKEGADSSNDKTNNPGLDTQKMLYIFIGPSLVFLLSIVSVACLLHRLQKSTPGATRDNDLSDYPDSHLRRPQMTRCQEEYDQEYNEYDYQTYEDYSEVRNTGP